MDIDLRPTYADASQQSASQATNVINAGSKLTYAAKQRSYLSEKSFEDELMLDMSTPMKSYCGHSNSQVSQNSQPEEAEDATGGMRSIHELRAAGSNKRFIMEMEGLLVDLEDDSSKSISLKRSAMMELSRKLSDQAALSRFMSNGLERRLFSHAASTADIVFAFARAATVAFVSESAPSLAVLNLMHDLPITNNLKKLLDVSIDIGRVVKQRSTNMSKAAIASWLEFKALIQNSAIWTTAPPCLSPRLLSLKALDMMIRKTRQAGSTDDVLDVALVNKLMEITSSTTQASGEIASMELELAVSILESASLAPAALHRHVASSTTGLTGLVELVTTVLNSQGHNPEVEILALRLCVQVLNNQPDVCVEFSTTLFVEPRIGSINARFKTLVPGLEEDERIPTIERLILTIGAMINLCEHSDDARLSVIAQGPDALHSLVSYFLEGQQRAAEADSMEEIYSNIAYGYLAVLLGNLCQNVQIREIVRSKLPEKSLLLLINAIEEFLQYHVAVDRKAFDGEEGNNVWSTFTDRLQKVAQRLRLTQIEVGGS